MPLFFRSLAAAAAQYGMAEALLRGHGVRRRMKRAAVGFVLLLVAAPVTAVTIVFLLASLFFALAHQTAWVMPALVTSLAGAAIVLLLLSEGTRRLRR